MSRTSAQYGAGHALTKLRVVGVDEWAWRKGAARGVTPELTEKLIEPYLKEAQAVVAEGIVADADLADAGLIFGTGFAPFHGGPLNYLKSKAGNR